MLKPRFSDHSENCLLFNSKQQQIITICCREYHTRNQRTDYPVELLNHIPSTILEFDYSSVVKNKSIQLKVDCWMFVSLYRINRKD